MHHNTTNAFTSRPYQLCLCESNKMFEVHRGQRFNISLLALDQLRNSVSTVVTAKISDTAALELKQNSQILFGQCSNLSYSLFSTQKHEEVTLYPDVPCRDTGVARVVINATLLPWFSQLDQSCVCEDRLQFYNADCIIDNDIYIRKKSGSNFWLGILNNNGSYKGLILYKTCPTNYCKSGAVNITLENLDIQCSANRGQLLCGSYIVNHSRIFGGPKCRVCPNTYLGLLLVFGAAGIILVMYLSFLRLTVATGMINSIKLYANIVQANKTLSNYNKHFICIHSMA